LRKHATQNWHITEVQVIQLGTVILEKWGRKNFASATKKLSAYTGNVQLPYVCVTRKCDMIRPKGTGYFNKN